MVFHCARPSRAFRFFTFSRGSRQTVVHCAHQATTALSWGLCEQEGWLAVPSHSLGCLEMQLRLHSFKYKELQERLIGDIALVGQRLDLIQKRFWQPE